MCWWRWATNLLEHSDPAAMLADAPAASLRLEPMLDSGARFEGTPPGPDDLFAIMDTSDSTGRPKGAQVTHRMMRLAGEAVARVSAARDGDVLFV